MVAARELAAKLAIAEDTEEFRKYEALLNDVLLLAQANQSSDASILKNQWLSYPSLFKWRRQELQRLNPHWNWHRQTHWTS